MLPMHMYAAECSKTLFLVDENRHVETYLRNARMGTH